MNRPLQLPVVVSLLCVFPASARAFIEAHHPLGRVCKESTNIVVMRVERVETKKNLILYRKVRDLKGSHPQEQVRHNIGQRGSHEREWKTVMAWAKEGREVVFFHNGAASVTCIDDYWYQCFKEGDWWAMSHAEPYLLRSYYGPAGQLAAAVEQILAGNEVVVPAMVDGAKEQFHERTGKVHRIKASLKIVDYDAKRDFVAAGRGEEPRGKADAKAEARPEAAKAKEKQAEAPPAVASGKAGKDKTEERPAEIVVDKAKRRVTIPCFIAPRKLPHLNEVYPVEVIATYPSPEGQKAHETVVTFRGVKPSQVHAALEQIGLKAGRPARGDGVKPEGPEVTLRLELPSPDKNGKPRRIPVEEALADHKTGKSPPPFRWHFTGSASRQADPEKEEKSYGADLTGTLVALFPVTDDVVIQAALSLKDESAMKFDTRKEVLPPEGTAVKLLIEAK
jgi:hypothetical protein